VTRPGDTVEEITVPLGNPDALVAAAGSLKGVSAQLQDASTQVGASPSLMSSWSGPGSSQFAMLTGQESVSLQSAATSVLMAGISVEIGADQLRDAQQRALRAIKRAKRARIEINAAKEAIREAVDAQKDAQGRMDAAVIARQTAEMQLFSSAVDSLLGSGAAEAAIAAADDAYRAAERDLQEAQRREARARDRLKEARDDLEQARKDGVDAAEDAETAGIGLRFALAGVPSGVLALPGMPAQARISDAAGIPRPQPRHVPISQMEPPEDWPGWMKSWYKIGRGEATVIAGTLGLAKKGYDDPEKIPGAFKDLGLAAYHDPLGTGKAIVGYDELAAGRWEDWMGQMGIGMVAGGGTATVAARTTRLPRIVGSPRIQQLGPNAPVWGPAFAGRRLDFSKPDMGARPNSGSRVTVPPNAKELASEYPKGVRYSRAGYPILTPYAKDIVYVDGLNGEMKHDNKLANREAGIPGKEPPDGYTWHHAEDGRRMELVPTDLHKAVQHTGGRAAMPDQLNVVTPGGAFTPLEQAFGGLGGAGGATAAGPAAAGSGP
jgi:hypothetical protein